MKNKIKSLISYLLIFLAVYFIGSTFIFSYQVHGTSMEPALSPDERGIAIKTTMGIVKPKRFSIVVINTGDEHYIVKRVIGLPNDHVEYRNNKLYINGEQRDEYFIDKALVETGDLEITLQDDEYYCLGDNRGHSADSRSYGPFSLNQIIAILPGGSK